MRLFFFWGILVWWSSLVPWSSSWIIVLNFCLVTMVVTYWWSCWSCMFIGEICLYFAFTAQRFQIIRVPSWCSDHPDFRDNSSWIIGAGSTECNTDLIATGRSPVVVTYCKSPIACARGEIHIYFPSLHYLSIIIRLPSTWCGDHPDFHQFRENSNWIIVLNYWACIIIVHASSSAKFTFFYCTTVLEQYIYTRFWIVWRIIIDTMNVLVSGLGHHTDLELWNDNCGSGKKIIIKK